MKKVVFPFSIKTIEDNSGFLLWQVTCLWQREQKRVLERYYNLTHTQYVILASTYWLTSNDREVTQTVLSKHTKIESMNISQTLKGLQEKGYIYRKSHSTDVRAKAVYLTQEGKDMMKDAIATIEAFDINFFKTLGKNIKQFNENMLSLIQANDLY